ncbi:MAG TPA: acyl-CoA dehydratase activase [Fibrobacteria bacterium]|nr:acyl-CoA dehydratase activase [Fibrobacteria bacterium]
MTGTPSNSRRSLGLCLGASSIQAVELTERPGAAVEVTRSTVVHHESDPREAVRKILSDWDAPTADGVLFTGRKLRRHLTAESISEPEALEWALSFLRGELGWTRPVTAVASLGAENFVVYRLDGHDHVASVETGSKCASGTGEFFLQQVGRMAVTPKDAVELARGAESYKVSGRCTVFCKSDCTHALNKGVPVGRVSAGLCKMMADKVLELLEKADAKGVLAVGGVSRNDVIMDHLKDALPGFEVPPNADCFEALGAAFRALRSADSPKFDNNKLFESARASFEFLPRISEGESLVRFASSTDGTVVEGDECVVGLDVGSTTTKAVVLRMSDDAVLASIYLRTNGDPIGASRRCYEALYGQVGDKARIVGISTTGSGRHIAGLHANTPAVINEIVAHATGAAHFDPEVDTIFEIGGQDAKYTHLTQGVPSDYAMNEACSAGTGSFLEEAARESLRVATEDIAASALAATRSPNFSDQCAAFIGSDIKTAVQEGLTRDEIAAGLVYSICQNYVNRVKGQRAVGKKVFMQGGVCYNKAVPLAMANLLGKEIVVPPNPGLMGAFGVALEAKDRIRRGTVPVGEYSLSELAAREVQNEKPFICRGGAEKCDRACEIAMLSINGKKYPFGGACYKYYNQGTSAKSDRADHDFVVMRQDLVFAPQPPPEVSSGTRLRVGIPRSFLTNQFNPFWQAYFAELGCEAVLSESVDAEGLRRKHADFCYPAEIAHGTLADLLKKPLDYVFLPKVFSMPVPGGSGDRAWQSTCLLVMSESYWLQQTFRHDLAKVKLLEPELDLAKGLNAQTDVLEAMAVQLGRTRSQGRAAARKAVAAQEKFLADLRQVGLRALERLEAHPERMANVLFGRPYNAFAKEANMGIPAKFASRGVDVIPWDALAFESEAVDPDINWAIGQNLLRAARVVAKHPQLFGTWVTNFSCGPDSFLVGYFRDIMGEKPSLTLELDSHTADAGVNTRIEAFLDIVDKFRQVHVPKDKLPDFVPAEIRIHDGQGWFVSSEGAESPMKGDPKVHVVFPSMGTLGTQGIAAIFNGLGFRATALPIPDIDALRLGRGNSSCKECLPLQLVCGSLLRYLRDRSEAGEHLVFFMPTSAGGCRLTQYNVYLRKLIEKSRIPNVAFLSLSNTNGYGGLATSDVLNALKSVILSDVMEDVRAAIPVLAADPDRAMEVFDAQWARLLDSFRHRRAKDLFELVKDVASVLNRIPRKKEIHEVPKVALHGEMYVRRDEFSCQDLTERFAKRGILAKRAHVFEYLAYSDWNVDQNLWQNKFGVKKRAAHKIKLFLQHGYEKKIKKAMARSGFYEIEMLDIPGLVKYGTEYFDVRFTGESLILVGTFWKDILHAAHGVVSIGPFACMPTRIIESVLSSDTTADTKRSLDRKLKMGHVKVPENVKHLPFLSIESDGNPFPQIVDTRVEAFCLQVERLHKTMEEAGH